ncbi:hypothetical protein GBAR_LOCUS14129 [Geodia barretti]|uniref:Uncharacterized protein n=1 Tax=Geodia barretti TaxID=519541 RepID=A0AA35S873_GEOBA|nr:hypothetical protein GBAR_LOCUS14129 [Geodia barretti]
MYFKSFCFSLSLLSFALLSLHLHAWSSHLYSKTCNRGYIAQ